MLCTCIAALGVGLCTAGLIVYSYATDNAHASTAASWSSNNNTALDMPFVTKCNRTSPSLEFQDSQPPKPHYVVHTNAAAAAAPAAVAASGLGPVDGTLGSCSGIDPCSSSYDDRPPHFVAPWQFDGSQAVALRDLVDTLEVGCCYYMCLVLVAAAHALGLPRMYFLVVLPYCLGFDSLCRSSGLQCSSAVPICAGCLAQQIRCCCVASPLLSLAVQGYKIVFAACVCCCAGAGGYSAAAPC
jgi:hypothetical protein